MLTSSAPQRRRADLAARVDRALFLAWVVAALIFGAVLVADPFGSLLPAHHASEAPARAGASLISGR